MQITFGRTTFSSLFSLIHVSYAFGQPPPAPQTMRATYEVAPAHREAVDAEDVEPSGPCVPDGWTIIDGDILMPISSLQRGCHVTNIWPGGVVPYVFASNISAEVEAAFLLAMAEWEAVADVLFVERGSQSNYVVIQDHQGYPNSSNSAVGCVGGRQNINGGSA